MIESKALTPEQQGILGRVSCALEPDEDAAVGLDAALRILCEALGAELGRVFLLEPRGGDLLLFAHYGEAGSVTRHQSAESQGEAEAHCVSVSIPGRDRELGRLHVGWSGLPEEGARAFLSEVARAMSLVLRVRFAGLRADVRREIEARGSEACLASALEALRSAAGAKAGELSFRPDGARVPRRVSAGSVDAECPHADDPALCSVVAGGHVGLFTSKQGEAPARCRGPKPEGNVLCLPLHASDGPRGCVTLTLDGTSSGPPTRDLVPLLEQVDEAAAVVSERLDPHGLRVAATALEIRCLGPFEVRSDGEVISRDRFARAKAWELLKRLALGAGRPIGQAKLAEALWPDVELRVGANRLHGVVHALRQVLEPADGEFTRVLRQGAGYLLDPASVHIDVVEFEERLGDARRLARRGDVLAAVAAYSKVVALYRGDLFAEAPADWCRVQRQSYRSQVLDASRQVGALCLARGVPELAVEALERGVAIDPFREDMQRQLAGVLLQLGRRAEARGQLEQCIETLSDGLDVDPEPETLALLQLVSDG